MANSQSLDLNPIGNVWKELKKNQVHKRRVTTVDELQIVTKEEWAKIPVNSAHIYYVMRLAANRGGPTIY